VLLIFFIAFLFQESSTFNLKINETLQLTQKQLQQFTP
jgi:hypothetical protein